MSTHAVYTALAAFFAALTFIAAFGAFVAACEGAKPWAIAGLVLTPIVFALAVLFGVAA